MRSLHTSGFGQQQEAVAVRTEPAPFLVFRTQHNDPVSKSLTGQMLSMTSRNTIHLPLDGRFMLAPAIVHFLFFFL